MHRIFFTFKKLTGCQSTRKPQFKMEIFSSAYTGKDFFHKINHDFIKLDTIPGLNMLRGEKEKKISL